MDRRRFLRTSAAVASMAGLTTLGSAQADDKARVVFYRHSGLPEMAQAEAATTVWELVGAAVRDATGAADAESAWNELFSADDVVAIKVNCMAGRLSPSMDLVNAIVEGLNGAGVDPDHILIFDKEDRDLIGAGYELRHEPPGPLVYGTVGGPAGPGYDTRPTTRGQTTYRLSNIVAKETTAIINVPVVKDHVFAGITGALKNHFGCIHNPEDFHYIDHCSPAIPEVNLAAPLRAKQRLIVGDARYVQYEGGPSFDAAHVFEYSGVFAGTDPVAVDSQLLSLIDTVRDSNGLPPINETAHPAIYLEAAAERDLGTLDPSRINLYYADFAEEA